MAATDFGPGLSLKKQPGRRSQVVVLFHSRGCGACLRYIDSGKWDSLIASSQKVVDHGQVEVSGEAALLGMVADRLASARSDGSRRVHVPLLGVFDKGKWTAFYDGNQNDEPAVLEFIKQNTPTSSSGTATKAKRSQPAPPKQPEPERESPPQQKHQQELKSTRALKTFLGKQSSDHITAVQWSLEVCRPCHELSKRVQKWIRTYPHVTFIKMQGFDKAPTHSFPLTQIYRGSALVDSIEGNQEDDSLYTRHFRSTTSSSSSHARRSR